MIYYVLTFKFKKFLSSPKSVKFEIFKKNMKNISKFKIYRYLYISRV